LPHIASLAPYKQGKSEIPGKAEPIKLSSNECCFGPSPAAMEAYAAVTPELHRYPDGAQRALRRAIGEVYGIDPDRVVCGNGSEEVIGLLVRCFVGAGDELLLPQNHFVMCSIYGKGQGADIVLAPEHEHTVDVDELLARVTDRTRMIAIANPNNPTGTYLPRDAMQRLIDNVPSDVVILLDGAYAQYVTAPDFDPGFGWADTCDNVFVTHTFSKIYGLAGLRIGWGYGPAHIVETINRLRTPFNASLESMAAAAAAVQDRDFVDRVREHTARWQLRLQNELGGLGIHVVPSVANFYLMHFERIPGKSANAAGRWLEDNGIIPRPAADDRCLRITIGTDEENEAVIRSLTGYITA
jgi:histidinol-phosphate aminotransferase